MAGQQANEHEHAIHDFREQLKQYTIRTPEPPIACGRYYVRVAKLTEWLGSEAIVGASITTQASRLLEYAYRNWHGRGHARSMTRAKLFEGENRCILVFSILLKMGWGDLIHLFRSLEKVDKHLPIDLLSLKGIFAKITVRDDCRREISKPDDLAVEFDKQQWQFCLAKFYLDEKPDFHRNRIIPIHKKEKIKDGRTATLWQIEVLQDFVGDKLGDVVKNSMYTDSRDDLGPRYHFALKVFKEGNKGICSNEIDAFTALRENGGMVRYLGGYDHQETEQSVSETAAGPIIEEETNATYNILLEYGDRDLDELFVQRLPPVLPDEIEAFWKGLFEVADAVKRMHDLKINNDGIVKEYCGWHADIKPNNILEIEGVFKLAGPGFAKFVEKAKEKSSSDPTANLSGGTYTFGAPERHPGRRDSGAAHQTIDVWSLGCVFSIAATWVVLGYQGIRRYRMLRENAIDSRVERQQSQPSLNLEVPKLFPSDCFHDGLLVLSDITSWHKYLRCSLRTTDRVTSQVLDLIDQHMLVGSPKLRMRSSAVCEQLGHITQTLPDSRTPVPDDIMNFLRDVDESIPSNPPDPVSIDTRLELTPALNTPHDRQVLKEKYLVAPLMKTTHRSYLKSTASTQPVVNGGSQAVIHAPVGTMMQNGGLTSGGPAIYSPASVAQAKAKFDYDNSSPPSALSASIKTSRSGVPGLPKRPKFRATPPQDVFQAREEMEKRDKEKSPLARFMQKEKDDLLAGYYQDRNIKFLVDNPESMKAYWGQAKHLLETLLMKAEGLDEDGVDLGFTQGVVHAENVRGKSKIMKKMADSRAIPRGGTYTDITVRLQKIFDDFIRVAKRNMQHNMKFRNLTVIVLTDGVWRNTRDKEDMNRSIVNFARRLEDLMGRPLTDRPVSIEFIQFGRDPDATYRLKRLDDNLVYDGVPDFIDTEHCTGDVNKMLLGSFVQAYDDINDDNYDDETVTGPSSPPLMTSYG